MAELPGCLVFARRQRGRRLTQFFSCDSWPGSVVRAPPPYTTFGRPLIVRAVEFGQDRVPLEWESASIMQGGHRADDGMPGCIAWVGMVYRQATTP